MKLDTYCPYPFMHAAQSSQESFQPCCIFDSKGVKTKYSSIKDYWNSDFLLSVRKNMLIGEQVAGCHKCYSEEKHTNESLRTHTMKHYGFQKNLKIKSLEVLLSNKCNLKCRMCSSDRSSKWINDEKLFSPNKKSTVYETSLDTYFPNDFDLSNIEHINILGGEPFLSRELNNFLLKFENKKNIKLVISTNGTFFPKKDFFEIIKDYKHIKIALSFDSPGKLGEYIRSGLNWEKFEDITQKWINIASSMKNLSIHSHCTLSAYNTHAILDVIQWAAKHNLTSLTFAKVYWPTELQPEALPANVKKKIYNYYFNKNNEEFLFDKIVNELNVTRFTHISFIRSMLIKILSDHTQQEASEVKFYEYTNKLDKIRGESFYEISPYIDKPRNSISNL